MFTNKGPKAKGHLNIVLKISEIYIKQNHALGGVSKVSAVCLKLGAINVYSYHWSLGNKSRRRIGSRLC